MKTVAIVNPHSAGGRTGRALDAIRAALVRLSHQVEVLLTTGPGDATALTRQALGAGASLVLAVGGDGTVGEVVSGFFDGRRPVRPSAEMSVLEFGTGGDFRRSLGIAPSLDDAVARLARGEVRQVDVGLARYATRAGPGERCFANDVSVGISADVAASVNDTPWTKRLAGAFAYTATAGLHILRHRSRRITFRFDGGAPRTHDIAVAVVSNGRWFGGGKPVAPLARIDDGLLDVVIVDQAPRATLLRAMLALERGQHLALPFVHHVQARTIAVDSEADDVGLELDGDTPGASLPARLDILPAALRVRA